MFLFTLSGVHMEDPPFLLGVGISAGVIWGGGKYEKKEEKRGNGKGKRRKDRR